MTEQLVFPKQKKKKVIPTFVYVSCPDCSKPRLLKQKFDDGKVEEVSEETYKGPDGSVRPVDVCGFCHSKHERRDKQFLKKEILKLQRAAEAAQAENDGDNPDIEL